jgi:hypothetical protein
MPVWCVECALKGMMSSRSLDDVKRDSLFEETLEAHIQRVHPNATIDKSPERLRLEARAAELLKRA